MSDDPSAVLRGERLVVLRDLRGLTQNDLASELSVTQSFVSHVEKGTRPLPASVAATASERYRLPLSFFSVSDGATDLGQHTFRKKAKASVRDERRVKAQFNEAARLFFDLGVLLNFRTVNLPDPAEHSSDPEECAEALRSAAGLAPDEPIKNVTRLVERHGVGVIAQIDDSAAGVSDHIGISRPAQLNYRPLIAITPGLPGAVQRLSVAHEVGHLIFDRRLASPLSSTRAPEENRAYRFAGALLLPERVARKRITSTLSLHGYLPIKADYGISVGAAVRRGRELGIISPERYRSLSIQMSSQGWRTHEPVDVAEERPLLFGQIFDKAIGHDRRALGADRYGIDPELLDRWLPAEPSTTAAPERNAKILTLRPTDQR